MMLGNFRTFPNQKFSRTREEIAMNLVRFKSLIYQKFDRDTILNVQTSGLRPPGYFFASLKIDGVDYQLNLWFRTGGWEASVFSSTIDEGGIEDGYVVPMECGADPELQLAYVITNLNLYVTKRRNGDAGSDPSVDQKDTADEEPEVMLVSSLTCDELSALVGSIWVNGGHTVVPHLNLEHTFVITVQMYEQVTFMFGRLYGNNTGPWTAQADDDSGLVVSGEDESTEQRQVLEDFRVALMKR